jgi:endoglucanase
MKRTHIALYIGLTISLSQQSHAFASNTQPIAEFNAETTYYGVNLAGGAFGNKKLPGRYGYDYTYPKADEMDYFIEKGMTVFRLPFRWERLQRDLQSSLDDAELQRITAVVNYATSKGILVILDIHNYARYHGDIVGGDNVSFEDLSDVWKRIAAHFKDNSGVVIGLMNEPHGLPTEQWRDAANIAISAIRSAGFEHLVLVPGNGYSGAHAWHSNWYGTPNSKLMTTIVDPADNFAFDLHQYFDADSSGTSPMCVSAEVGVKRLTKVTNWMRNNNYKAFLGEFGVADNDTCNQALTNALEYMNNNSDVWIGWTWWAAGAWWGDYPFSLTPKNNQDKPQMAILESFLTP